MTVIITKVYPWSKVLEKLWNTEAVKKFPSVLSPKPSNNLSNGGPSNRHQKVVWVTQN